MLAIAVFCIFYWTGGWGEGSLHKSSAFQINSMFVSVEASVFMGHLISYKEE